MSRRQPDTQAPLVFFEGRVVPWNEARVHVFAPVVKYGAGVFDLAPLQDSGTGGLAVPAPGRGVCR